MEPWPEFIQDRINLFDKLMMRYQEEVAKKERTPIVVTLPDGKRIDARAWETTPLQIALGISKGLADKTIVAKVNGEVGKSS